MAKKEERKEKIKQSVDKIRDECDEIEEEVEPKKVSTRGDPIAKIY